MARTKAEAGPRRILVVDDQPQVAELVEGVAVSRGFTVSAVTRPADVPRALESGLVDLVILDYDLGPRRKNGLQVLEELRRDHPDLPVVLLSGQGTIDVAVRAMKLGAEDFLEKDDDVADRLEIMLDRMGRHLDVLAENRRLRDENSVLKTRVDVYKEEIYRKYQIVGVSAAMRKVCAMVERVAPIPRPVLVVGERGTGKELVAAAIHRASPRRGAPFVTINCAAFAEGLLECELYGQEENAFTNAPFRRGRFEQADGGTLFMDEVANMPLPFQQTVLRVLEYQRFERVGGGKTLQVDVRVVAATNADLAAERRAGRFRDDLYDRLAFETVVLPPLRDRPEDVGPLARHFLSLIRLEVPEIRPHDFDDGALDRLTTYPWPGNVRELKHYVERAAYRADAEILTPHELPPLEPGA